MLCGAKSEWKELVIAKFQWSHRVLTSDLNGVSIAFIIAHNAVDALIDRFSIFYH